jgi:hypothetical protein
MRAITSFNPIFPSVHIVIPETTSANVTSLQGRPFPGITHESDKVVVVGSVGRGGNTIDVVVVETGLLVEEVLVVVLELVRVVVVDILPRHAGQERRHCITESRTHEPADHCALQLFSQNEPQPTTKHRGRVVVVDVPGTVGDAATLNALWIRLLV